MTNHEKNEAVARKLGWKQTRKKYSTFDGQHDSEVVRYRVSKIPNYCGSIETAWGIVKHLIAKEFQVILNMDSWGKTSCNIHQRREYLMIATADASTAPEAIVDAFLKLP